MHFAQMIWKCMNVSIPVQNKTKLWGTIKMATTRSKRLNGHTKLATWEGWNQSHIQNGTKRRPLIDVAQKLQTKGHLVHTASDSSSSSQLKCVSSSNLPVYDKKYTTFVAPESGLHSAHCIPKFLYQNIILCRVQCFTFLSAQLRYTLL